MPAFTVEIQASNADQSVWQALHPAENTEGDSAETVAVDVAQHQTIAEGDNWRVCVWDGNDADTGRRAAAEFYAEDL